MIPLLQVEDLRVEFRAPNGIVSAVSGVSFVQNEEEVFCIVGESGAGKSALALAIMGLLPDNGAITGGRILFDGVDLVSAPAERRRELRGKAMSLVFQDAQSALNPVQTIGAQLTEVILTHSALNRRAAAGVCREMLRELGVPDPAPDDVRLPLHLKRRAVPAGNAGDGNGNAPAPVDCGRSNFQRGCYSASGNTGTTEAVK